MLGMHRIKLRSKLPACVGPSSPTNPARSIANNTSKFDLVYIDASHWYDDVVNDINTWLPKIKNGGYLAGHDYIEGIDVLYAVNDFFGKTHSITRYPDSSWVIKKN